MEIMDIIVRGMEIVVVVIILGLIVFREHKRSEYIKKAKEDNELWWKQLSYEQQKVKAEEDFEGAKFMCAAALNAINLICLLIILFLTLFHDPYLKSLVTTPLEDLIPFRYFLACSFLFFGIVPLASIYFNLSAKRARQHGVFHLGRKVFFLNLGFISVVMSCFLIAFPSMRFYLLLIPYFSLAGYSLYVLVSWVFFKRPPEEGVPGVKAF